jgi:hypothetical protein
LLSKFFRVCFFVLFVALTFCALYPKHVLMEVIEWQVSHYFKRNLGVTFETKNKKWKEGALRFVKGTLSDSDKYHATFDRAEFVPKISFKEGIFGGKLLIDSVEVEKFTYEPLPVIRRKKNPWFSIDLDVVISQAKILNGNKNPLTLNLKQKIKGKSFEGVALLQWNPDEPDLQATFSYDADLDQHMIATKFSGHTIQDFYETLSALFPYHLHPLLSKWRAKGGALFGSLQATFSNGVLKRVVTDLDLDSFEGENLPFQIQLGAKRLGVHLNLDCSSCDKIEDWHGKFDIEEGNLAFHPFSDRKWDTLWRFQDIHSSIHITDGKVGASQLSGKLMGMEGVLSLCPSKEEILSLEFNGVGEEVAPYLPPSLQETFSQLFEHDLFQLKAHCIQKKEGLSLEGALDHIENESSHTLFFGCLFREDPHNIVELQCPEKEGFSDQVKRFAHDLQQQFHVSQKRLGWFKTGDFEIEKYLSPFFFQASPFSMEGKTAIEGSFDENHLVAFYSGENLIFKGRDFSFSLHQMENDPETKISAVHCFDLKNQTHSGFLPIENATYDYHKKGIVFPNCKAIAYFNGRKIHMKGMEAMYRDLRFKGEASFHFDKKKGLEALYEFSEIKGSYASACALYEKTYDNVIPFNDFQGNVSTIGKGMMMRYQFEGNQTKMIESRLFGTFDLEGERFGAQFKKVKGNFSTRFPDSLFRIENATGQVTALNQAYELYFPKLDLGSDIVGECTLNKAGVPVFSLNWKRDHKAVSARGEWRGYPINFQGIEKEKGMIEASSTLGDWKGELTLQKEEKWNITRCCFKHPLHGSLDLTATMEAKGVKGAIQSFTLDIGELFQKQHSLWNTQGKIAGYGEFSFDETLNGSVILSNRDLAVSGLRFADGEYLECCFSAQRGVTVKGLKALVPLKEGDESYQLGQLVYDPVRERIFFDKFTFSLPTYRTTWLQAVSQQLLDKPLDSSLFDFINTLKKDQTLRGTISAEVTKGSNRFYLSLEDGEYCVLGKKHPLKNVRLCVSNQGFVLESEHSGLERLLWLELSGNEALSSGVLFIRESMEKTDKQLVLNWFRDQNGKVVVDTISGSLFGIKPHLVLRETFEGKARYHGKLRFVAEEVSTCAPAKWASLVEKLNPAGDFIVDGEWMITPKEGLHHFSGIISGKECLVMGTRFDTISAYMEANPEEVSLEGLQLEDWCGDLTIPSVRLFKKESQWRFAADKVLLTNFRLSRLNSPAVNPKRTRPLCRSVYIPRFELNQFEGELSNPSSYHGSGVLLFTNYTRKNILTNFFLVPAEISARIGLDPNNFIPARGRVHYTLDQGEFVIHDLEDVYSEGKRSRFFLEENTIGHIDYTGNLDMKIKMKQYNLLMKFTELLTISVKGTLFDPIYVFESYSEDP